MAMANEQRVDRIRGLPMTRTTDQPIPTTAQRRLAQQLYLRYSAALLAFFRSTLRMTQANAMDLLQQTFSELLRTLARHPDLEITHPRAFLFKLATRQLTASLRRSQRRPPLDDGVDVAEAIAQDDLEHQASLHQDQRLVLRAMRRLTDDRRRRSSRPTDGVSPLQLLVYFRFWVGLTLAEVAEILDLSPDAVAGRQRRALQKLQRNIEEIERETGVEPSTSTTILARWREVLEREAGSSEITDTGDHRDHMS